MLFCSLACTGVMDRHAVSQDQAFKARSYRFLADVLGSDLIARNLSGLVKIEDPQAVVPVPIGSASEYADLSWKSFLKRAKNGVCEPHPVMRVSCPICFQTLDKLNDGIPRLSADARQRIGTQYAFARPSSLMVASGEPQLDEGADSSTGPFGEKLITIRIT